ncbi:MAG: polysaccharide biosynthesis protein [Deltaproteobacteria bacterium]|nr:polysaccharide biosynthesis protein [Deltaproteobacteria bacterium]
MQRYINRGAQITVDMAVLSISYWLAFLFRFELSLEFMHIKLLFFTWPYVIILQYLLLSMFGVPRFAWRYVGLRESKSIFYALLIATSILVAMRLGFVNVGGYAKFVIIPLGVLAMDFIMAFLGITGVRVIRRIVSEGVERDSGKRANLSQIEKTLLIGAGRAGVMVAKEIDQNPGLGMKIVGYVDDDPIKTGTIIQGHRILGDTASLLSIMEQTEATQAIISIASANGPSIRKIVDECKKVELPVKIIPGIYEILGGKVNLSRIREVTIDDLLGREAVNLDREAIAAFLKNKTVMVTGAGGSIGSEACRQIALFNPAKLILLEQAENALFFIHKELTGNFPELNIIPCIADVADIHRLDEVFNTYKPQVIFHAAAHKHVPMMEWNPGEAVKNNVFGTKNVVDASDKHNVETFVMISTDKAVNPTSIMGTTKRCAEIYVQAKSSASKTKFVAVRFGNVLGSNGSVIPIFKEQIAKGGPVTVTHKDMKRYFMTIPEACQLVMQTATMGESGDIFVLDMGKPVYIRDLAKDIIHLSGFSTDEIEIKYSGLRPGEKLFEELAFDGEKMDKTRHPKIFTGKIEATSMAELEPKFNLLKECINSMDNNHIRACLKTIVVEMREPDTE